MIVLEHVASINKLTRFLQTVYTWMGWSLVLDGCELNRETVRWLLEAPAQNGGTTWKTVKLQGDCESGYWEPIPRVYGTLVKED